MLSHPLTNKGDYMTEPSIEDMQKQIAELQDANAKQKEQIDVLLKSSEQNENDLKKARELNTALLLRVTSPNPENGEEQEEKEDTIESICDDVVESVNKEYIERFKHAD